MADIDFISPEGQTIVNRIKQESNVDEQIHNLLVNHAQQKIPALLSTIGYINNEIHECFMNNRFWSTTELRILLKKVRNTLLEGLDFPGTTDFRNDIAPIDIDTISGMEMLSKKIDQHLQTIKNGSSSPSEETIIPLVDEIVCDNDNIPTLHQHKKKATLSYLNNLTATRNDITLILDISEDINETNYQIIFEEYKEYIYAHPRKIELQTIINKKVGTYNTLCSKNKEKYWIGECLLLLQSFLNMVQKEVIPLSLEEQSKALLLQQEITYFPQIIQILQTFKETFSVSYFLKSPAEIKRMFSVEYISCVLHPIMTLHSDLFSFSENEMKILSSSHRKKELYSGIPSLFEDTSDVTIETAIARNFFFGEIDDLIAVLENMYKENIV